MLLAGYCGYVTMTKDRAELLMLRMGFVKRKGSNSMSKSTVEHFHQLSQKFLDQGIMTIVTEDILPELILEWYQTSLNVILSFSWMVAEKGSKVLS